MPRITIQTDRLHLEILPGLGAGIAAFSLRRTDGSLQPLMRQSPRDVSWFNHLSSYLLVPWSNRIPAGRFSHRGREHQVRPDWTDGSAIHGLVKDRPWRIVERSPVTAILAFHSRDFADLAFPWPFEAIVRYELFDDALATRLTVRHTPGTSGASGDTMPAGLGFHPYFPRTLWDPSDRIAIRYSARARYPAAAQIPTAPARPDDITAHLASGTPLDDLLLDDVFLGSADGATVSWPASRIRLTFSCSESLSHAVVYTGLPGFVCLEPVSMVTDGFNLASRGWPDTGVANLAPGQSLTADWTLRVEPL